MTPEDEEFNRIEMESRIRQEGVKTMRVPDYQTLMEELAVARMLVRELGDRLAKLEKPWVDLHTIAILDIYQETLKEWRGGHQVNGQIAFARALEAKIKEKNT